MFEQYFKESFFETGELKNIDITCPENFNFAYDIVDVLAEKEPNRRAMQWANPLGEEKLFTFSDISALSSKAANVFLSQGIKKGDHVMVILKNNYQYWYAVLGLHKIGAITIPATNQLTAKDIVYRINTADITAVICTAEGSIASSVEQAEKECGVALKKFIARGKRQGFIDFDEAVEAASDKLARIENHKDDPFLLYFTSGTTGYPKMAVHPHSYALAHYMTAKYWQNIDPQGLHATISDTGWGLTSWGKIYGQWIVGGGLFIWDYDRFDPLELLDALQKYQVTTLLAAPTILRFFAKEGVDESKLKSLKYITTAGEALNLEVYKFFLDLLGVKIMEGFGQTETTLCIGNLAHSDNVPGAMGRCTPLYDVRVVDEQNNELPTGEVGEVVIKLKNGENFGLYKGYYKDEQKTKEAFKNGFYHTGDTAYRDESGCFWYVGRKDDLINSSGYRIGPFEIESVLMEHPAVRECAITGVPDEQRGQVIKATIALTAKYKASDELSKELQNFVKNQTAPYKYPRIIEFVEELPKTISGKIRRVEIREKDS